MADRHLFHCEDCGKAVHKAERPTMGSKAFAKLRFCSRACASRRGPSPLARFHASYEMDERGCWVWQKAKAHGYGTFWDGGRFIRAHRWIYEQVHGPLGAQVCRHRCDNPSCVNPAHLLPGTQAQNIADAVRRNRHAAGERSGNAKITASDALAIRRSNEPLRVLADRYGLANSTVCQIRKGQRWRHLG